MSHVSASHQRRWRHALATAVATLGLAGSVGLVPVQASPEPSGVERSQAVDERRGNPKAYKFYRFGGKVVHWNRCNAIGYRVYVKGAPRKGLRDAREAMRRVNVASGLKFRYRGISRVKPSRKGGNYARGTDLVVGWLPKQRFNGNVGLGGWQANGNADITSGFVMINRGYKLRSGFGQGPLYGHQGTTGQILMHEAGHAVGLDHVGDKSQIMWTNMRRRPATWGAGDFNGLKRLGRARTCN